jgi:phosphohistidine swiveling domain-containing protein
MHLAGLGGILSTLKNFIALNKIKLRPEEYFGLLKEKLSAPFVKNAPFPEILKSFLDDYGLIFSINLLADKAIKSVSVAVAKEPIGVSELLAAKMSFENEEEEKIEITGVQFMKGNALEINDESQFVASEKLRENNQTVNQWWTALPQWKQTYFMQLLLPAFKFIKMREQGRWLTVKKISELRYALVLEAKTCSMTEKSEIYFAEIEEIINKKINLETCRKRKEDYINNSHYEFPARLTGKYITAESQMKGISAGIAEGYMKTVNDFDLKGCILYTKLLTPDLTKYFGDISGIISENGGMLSHLAIMAREQHIPVVAGFNLVKSGIKTGEKIKIDGNTGTVEKI